MRKDAVFVVLFCFTQGVWVVATMGVMALAIVLSNGSGSGSGLYVLALIIYAIATFGIFFDKRWAWIVSVLFLAGYWVLFGWLGCANFVVNVAMFASGHELYQDSPMTIMVVLFRALFGIVPATILLFLGIVSRRHISQVLRGRRFEPV